MHLGHFCKISAHSEFSPCGPGFLTPRAGVKPAARVTPTGGTAWQADSLHRTDSAPRVRRDAAPRDPLPATLSLHPHDRRDPLTGRPGPSVASSTPNSRSGGCDFSRHDRVHGRPPSPSKPEPHEIKGDPRDPFLSSATPSRELMSQKTFSQPPRKAAASLELAGATNRPSHGIGAISGDFRS